jgi:ribonuclease J
MEAVDVGPFSITPIPVDHSAFDAVAYRIQAEGKHILYTGDLRAHGRKPGMLHQLKRLCRKNQWT